jgi:type II secretory pathway pseudopilin PulG
MRKSFYEAFTLVEMLIVMGILIILMVIGIAAGRFAINRANDVAHQNAADQIYQGLQAYYTDHREYPITAITDTTGGTAAAIKTLIGPAGTCNKTTNVLCEYLDAGAFNGGTDATFYYFTNPDKQSALICVSLGGLADIKNRGFYCSGNGFGDSTIKIGGGVGDGSNITQKMIPYSSTASIGYTALKGSAGSAWESGVWK